jgi:hypothetical protein
MPARVDSAGEREAAGRGGCGDELDDHLAGQQRLAAPVPGDAREHALLDAVLLAGPGRVMSDANRQAGFGGELLQLDFPEAQTDPYGLPYNWSRFARFHFMRSLHWADSILRFWCFSPSP